MEKWQPIETAPRDGTVVMLVFPDGSERRGRFHQKTDKSCWTYQGEDGAFWRCMESPVGYRDITLSDQIEQLLKSSESMFKNQPTDWRDEHIMEMMWDVYRIRVTPEQIAAVESSLASDALDEEIAAIRDEPEMTEHEVMLGLAKAAGIDTSE